MSIQFAVLGDSIAWGQGASGPADTIGARLTAALNAHGFSTEYRVFAVPGARSEGLAPQVRAALAWPPDLALIIIGANDLTHLVAPAQAAAQLGAAVRSLRAAGTQVVVSPAPDLSAAVWVPPAVRALVRAASAAMRAAQTRAVLAAAGRVAAIDGAMAAAFRTDRRLFAADGFHPSSAGYEVITTALTPAVFAAVGAARAQAK